jgi:hypothetical protein
LKRPEANFLNHLNANDVKEARRQIINCILATDMAKHGEIMNKFKGYAEAFNFEDTNHRQTLMLMIVKCADISNEVRPTEVSEKWVDSLLEEFFAQSDKEKIEGLPVAPFMDRQKVTKPSAQGKTLKSLNGIVGFIGFVLLPLYELLSKVVPNLQDTVLGQIKAAKEYYQHLLDESKKA